MVFNMKNRIKLTKETYINYQPIYIKPKSIGGNVLKFNIIYLLFQLGRGLLYYLNYVSSYELHGILEIKDKILLNSLIRVGLIIKKNIIHADELVTIQKNIESLMNDWELYYGEFKFNWCYNQVLKYN